MILDLFIFWSIVFPQGFWKEHLRGRSYHIRSVVLSLTRHIDDIVFLWWVL